MTQTTNIGLKKIDGSENWRQIFDYHNDSADKTDSSVAAVQDGLAIVANGNTHAAIASGQFVYVRNHSTLAEGLYKATAAIATNGTLSTSNLATDGSGGLNDLQGQVTTLNSKMSYSRAFATLNETYIDSGSVYIYSIGNIRLIEFSDVKFKESLPSSSASNQLALFTLPFTIASGKSEIFILTKQDSTPTTIRLMAKENIITPWWSSIGVTSGEGFFGIVVCII